MRMFCVFKNTIHFTKHSRIILEVEKWERIRKLSRKPLKKFLHDQILVKETFNINSKKKTRKKERKRRRVKEQKREFRVIPYLFRIYVNLLTKFTAKLSVNGSMLDPTLWF